MNNSEKGERLTLDVPEAGRLLGVSRPTAYSLANQGLIPTIRLGHRVVVPKAALLKMLENAGKPEVQN
ncbi:MAG: helix-turn-helix domain-containing protein [Dehalococcoidia bacterium]|nr:helix-turn-helix domain-containing protein [Dehalococcoidia bacterium]